LLAFQRSIIISIAYCQDGPQADTHSAVQLCVPV
jgi:hypothetical protein